MKFITLFFWIWASHACVLAQTNNAESYLKQGKEKMGRKEYKRAITDFSISLEMELSVEALTLRASAKSLVEDYVGALADLDDVIRIDSYDPVLYNNRGNVKDELEREVEAVKDYDKAISLDSVYTTAYYNRGITRFNQTLYEEAKQDFEKVSRLQAKDAEAMVGIALCLIKLNKKNEACIWLEKAKLINPTLAEEFLKQNCQ